MDRSPKKPPPPPAPAPRPKSSNDWRGKLLASRYQIGAQLGAGGFGIVYRAWDRRTRSAVAIKVLRDEFGGRPALRRRFAREAKALLTLSHPHVVSITDCGLAEGMPFFAMELLEGHALERELKGHTALPPERAFIIIQQLLAGLSYVHSKGLVHRDLKPGNIFLQRRPDGEERVKLLDFGLAKFIEPSDPGEGASLTGGGEVVGTPAYMPPEQLASQQGDHRADVYSAAVVLFQMLAGRRPFEGEPYDVLRMVLVNPAPSLSSICPERNVLPEVDAVFDRALRKDPEERYRSADDFADVLSALPPPKAWLIGPPEPAEGEPPRAAEPSRHGSGLQDGPPAVDRPSPMDAGSDTYALESVAGSLWFVRYGLRTLRLLFAAMVGAVALIFLVEPEWGERLQERLSMAGEGYEFWRRRSQAVESHSSTVSSASETSDPSSDAFLRCDQIDGGLGCEDAWDGGAVESQASEEGFAKARDAARVRHVISSAAKTRDTTAEPATVVIEPVALRPEPEADTEVARAKEAAEGAFVPPASESPDAERVAPRNPWAKSVPRSLRIVRRSIMRGHPGDEWAINLLRSYNRTHPEDARGHLLMARMFMNRGWERDAVNQYRFAYQRDPASRGDPRMLRDLLSLTSLGHTVDAASGLIREAFGEEAQPALEAAIRRTDREDARGYLTGLRDSLARVQ